MHVDYPLYHGYGGYRRKLERSIKIKEWLGEYRDVVVHPGSLCMTLPFLNRVSSHHVWLSFHFYGNACPFLNQNPSIHVCLLKIFPKNKSQMNLFHPKISSKCHDLVPIIVKVVYTKGICSNLQHSNPMQDKIKIEVKNMQLQIKNQSYATKKLIKTKIQHE